MKTAFCILLLGLIAAALAETPQEKLRKYSDECKTESGVSEESLNKVRNHEHVDDPKLKDHGYCILKKSGFMNDDGHLLVDTIKTKFKQASDNHEGIEKLVNKCAVEKDTPQDTAAHFFTCVHEARQKAKSH